MAAPPTNSANRFAPIEAHFSTRLPHNFSSIQQGGVSGSIAKTATAPIERVKLLIQTQDANPKVSHHVRGTAQLCASRPCTCLFPSHLRQRSRETR